MNLIQGHDFPLQGNNHWSLFSFLNWLKWIFSIKNQNQYHFWILRKCYLTILTIWIKSHTKNRILTILHATDLIRSGMTIFLMIMFSVDGAVWMMMNEFIIIYNFIVPIQLKILWYNRLTMSKHELETIEFSIEPYSPNYTAYFGITEITEKNIATNAA